MRAHRRPAHGGLRRLLRRRAGQPGRRLRGQGDHHRRRRVPPRRAVSPQAGRRRGGHQGRRAGPAGRQGAGGAAYGSRRRLGREPRRVVARHRREGVDGARVRVLRLRAPAVRDVHVRHDRQAQGHPAHDRRLPGRDVVHALGGLRPQGRHRRLLVHRRRRLGDRPQLHGLRPALERRHAGRLRGHARHPAQGPLVGDHPAVRRDDLLHRTHRDPDLHEVGSRHPREVRPVLGAPAGVGGRADQPGGLHLVPRDHRLLDGAGRRHLVADRDRPDHDQPAAGRDGRQAGVRDEGAAGCGAPTS